MYHYLFYHHGGSENHGCEAIVRSTAKILSQSGSTHIYVASYSPLQDEMCFSGCDRIQFGKAFRLFCLSNNAIHFIDASFARIFRAVPFLKYQMKASISAAKIADAIFSVGGDIYSNGNSIYLSLIDKQLKKCCKVSILFACSIDEKDLDPNKNKYKIKNLKSYSLITARDSLTYNNLLKLGFQNVKFYPDPAFTLDTVCLPLPSGFAEGNTVGINVSPLIMKYEQRQNMVWENYRQLIRYILQSSDMKIALIPHVVQQGNDDRIPLRNLYDEFKQSGRMVMVEDHNCMELKGYISRCRMFVCARTHASIAAYSTCVPTLVVGYSVKSKGIAKDIFGSYEHYVIPAQSMQKDNDLVAAFQWLIEHENEIRSHLKEFMPGYCAKAWEAGKEIQKLIGENN